jgi:glucokinase
MFRAGVDLGGTKIQVAIVDKLNRVLGTDRRPTPTIGTPDGVTDTIALSVKAAVTNAGVDLENLVGIGVGGPGQIDKAAGTLSNAGNLPGWMITYPLAAELSRRLGGIPVELGNDVQVAVNAEVRLGAGREYNSMIGVFCGTGVGGGVVINDEMWLGRGAAGEIGHVQIMAEGGAKCTCGRRGCMEAYAGRAAMEITARKWAKRGMKTELFKIMEKKKKPRLASGVWDTALKRNDKMARKLIDRAIWALGSGIGSSVNLTDVQAVIIGGGLGIRLGQPFVDEIREAMLPHLIKRQDPPAVLLAELGDMGGALGAALLVEKHLPATTVTTDEAGAIPAPIRPPVNQSAVGTSAAVAKQPAPAPRKAAAKKAPVRKAPVRKAPARKAAPPSGTN